MSQPHHLSIGFAGGGISSLLLQLLREWQSSPTALLVEPPGTDRDFCQCSVLLNWDLTEKELWVLLVGVVIGILLLPVIELLLVLRQAWSFWLRSKLLGPAGKPAALYRQC